VDSRLWWKRGRLWSPHYCKPLRSNAELVVRQSPAIKDMSMEDEEATSLEAVTRKPVRTQRVL
jgi:hypothetical protein